MSDDVVMHFGVKGMKWGVRKEDEQEYSDQANRIRSELEQGGYSKADQEALKAKYGPEPTQKSGLSKNQKIAIGVGVGVVAAGIIGYGIYRGGRELPLDITRNSAYGAVKDGLKLNWDEGVDLGPGSVLKRISSVAETKVRPDGFFACFREDDVNSYKAILPSFWRSWGVGSPSKGGYINHYKAATSIKAPSGKETMEIFKELMSDSKIRESTMLYSSDQNAFRFFARTWTNSNSPGTKEFFDLLKSRGYNAVIDFNDAGALGKTPLRVIDGSIFEIIKNEPLKLDGMLKAAREWTPALIHYLFGGFMSDSVNAHLSRYGIEADDSFAHYGVPGMKWGKRRNGEAVSDKKLARMNRQADRGDARIEKSGTRGRAAGRVIGREFATQFLIGAGSSAVQSLAKNNPKVRAGVAVAGSLASLGSFAKSVSDIHDINQATDRKLTS